MSRTVYRGFFLAGISVLAVVACAPPETGGRGPDRGDAAGVITTTLRSEQLFDEIQALGTARANESIEIRPRVASVVTRVDFDEGKFVNAGDLLVELENSEIRANLAIAEAALSESRSSFQRSQSLAATKAISESSLEQLRAAMQSDEAAVQAARARLANTSIRAPFSGRIGLRHISPGGFVDTGTVIATLDDTDTIKLDFTIPEVFVSVVREGMDIVAQSLVYPDREFHGTIKSIDTRLDPVSRSVIVRAALSNKDHSLMPGMFLTVDLKRDLGEVLLAPEEAIVPEGDEQFLFVVNDGVAQKRAVTLGRRVPGAVVIVDGATAGESVIREGTQKARDGVAVLVIDDVALNRGSNVSVGTE